MLKELTSSSIKFPRHSKNKKTNEAFKKNLENYKKQEKLAKRISKYPPKKPDLKQILKSIPSNEKKLYSKNFTKELFNTIGTNSSKYAFLTTDESIQPCLTSKNTHSKFNYDHNEMLNNINNNIVHPFSEERKIQFKNSKVLKNNVLDLKGNVKEMNSALEDTKKSNNDLIIKTNKFKCDYLEKKYENENLDKEVNNLKNIIEKIREQIKNLNRQTNSMNNLYNMDKEKVDTMKNEMTLKKEEIKSLENDNKNNRSILLLFNSKCNDIKLELEKLNNTNKTVGKGLEFVAKNIKK